MHTDDNLRRQYLEAMGIPVWERRALSVPPMADAEVQKTVVTTPDNIPRPAETSLDWAALEAAVRSCTKCDLHKTRTQTVFGVGNRKAYGCSWRGPGADEDRREPFRGWNLNARAALGPSVKKCL
jgi:DNA polymerase